MNIRYPIYEGVYRILTVGGTVYAENGLWESAVHSLQTCRYP